MWRGCLGHRPREARAQWRRGCDDQSSPAGGPLSPIPAVAARSVRCGVTSTRAPSSAFLTGLCRPGPLAARGPRRHRVKPSLRPPRPHAGAGAPSSSGHPALVVRSAGSKSAPGTAGGSRGCRCQVCARIYTISSAAPRTCSRRLHAVAPAGRHRPSPAGLASVASISRPVELLSPLVPVRAVISLVVDRDERLADPAPGRAPSGSSPGAP